ncbi:MAG: paraquat-inducible protein A, partial [Deltaproteobacteria bacterium]|nr:paraquat-inducible protein A [Deltaproteobacteria bacterium]
MDSQPIIVCHDCDLILDNRHIPSGYASNCPRCGAKIPYANPESVERVLVFCLTALILYIPATFLPIMDLNSFGFTSVGNIFNSVTVTFQQGFYLMAAVLLLTAVIIPLLLPLLLFIISVSILTKRAPALQAALLRTFQYLKEWGMSDIYLLGILIAIIKIAGLATIQYRVGFFCFIGLTVFTLLAANALHKSIFWGEIGDQLGVKPDPDIDKL